MAGTPDNDLIHGTLNQGDTISGGDGNDTIFGGTNNRSDQANTGNDSILGEVGDDALYGQDGNDSLIGGVGNDQLDGGPGSDSLDGGEGNDRFLLRDTDNTGTDTILGGTGSDAVYVLRNDVTTVTYSDAQGAGTLASGATALFDGIENISTGGGADSFNGTAAGSGIGVASGAGNDTVTGSAFRDNVNSGAGDDSLTLGAGDDTVDAGDGNDSISGGTGLDRLYGSAGIDTIDGGADNDLIVGGDGADSLVGGTGNDDIFGDSANSASTVIFNDTISAGDGDDRVFAGSGDDSILGGNGNDIANGEDGNDTIRGDAGSDNLSGGTGNDDLNGGDGNDVMDGGVGNDLAYGWAGDDTVRGGDGSDNLVGDNSAGRESETMAGNDLLIGGAGGDHIDGNAGNDTIFLGTDSLGNGDGTNNQAYGGGGSDTIRGEGGSDTIYGDGRWATSGGNDLLFGYGGNDILLGDQTGTRVVGGQPAFGDDTIDGGTGNDTLGGDAGNDLLTGGEGTDVFIAGSGADKITDFTVTGVDINNGDQTDNDFVNLGEVSTLTFAAGHNDPDLALSPGWGAGPATTVTTGGYYTEGNMEAWNAASGTAYLTPLEWLRSDFRDDGILNQPDGLNLTLQGVTDAEQLTFDNTNVPCFAVGTLILTQHGEVAIETLIEGDLVMTRDNGLQPLRWIGKRQLDSSLLSLHENLRPIRIRSHALGTNIPAQDLLVSPQHRVLVRSKIAQKMFNTSEVLVAAKLLCNVEGIDIAQDVVQVEYVHILFDRHEIVISNGAETESLYTGPEALQSVAPAARDEIVALFPELMDRDYRPYAARPLTNGRMGRKLAARHKQNCKPLIESAISSETGGA